MRTVCEKINVQAVWRAWIYVRRAPYTLLMLLMLLMQLLTRINVLIAVCARKYVNKRKHLNYARQLFGNKVGRMMIKLE